ncbi:HAMP domain-containing histidine kinase [Nitriliruptoraceae bacterium ZYF776]|nr:HAMP domain-containing histidine kinase [Profundirhabdus halotolerans]
MSDPVSASSAPTEPPPGAELPPVPLGRQLVQRVVLPLLAGFLVFLIPLVVLAVRDAQRQVVQLAEQRAATFALVAQDVVGVTGSLASLNDLDPPAGEQFAIVLPTGERFVTSPLPQAVAEDEVVQRALSGTIAADRVVVADDGQGRVDLVVGAAPIVVDGRVFGAAVATLRPDAADDQLRASLLLLGILTALLLGAATWVGRSFARTIVRPLAELDRVASHLAAGDLAARAPTDAGPAELRRLAVTLNRSADRLRRLLDAQRRFVADASHQLRTPLAGLRLRLETAAMSSGDPDGRLEAATAEVDRLVGLVNDLLVLARSEEGRRDPVVTELGPVVEDRVAAWTLVGQERDVELRHEPGPSVAVWALPGALEQVLDNLLANALEVAPAGSSVEVSVRVEGDGVRCLVADRGPGLSDEDRERAFERFWRAADAPSGGSGLGLPIVAELVGAAGGSARLLPREGGGTVAEVVLRPADR